MVNFRDLALCLRATRSDAFVVLVTFLASWFFTLDVVLDIGIALSLSSISKAAVPFLIEYTFNNLGKLRPIAEEDGRLDPRICTYKRKGSFFGAAYLSLDEIAQHCGR